MVYICSSAGDPAHTIVVATGNLHKLVEIREILSPRMPGMQFVPIADLGDFADPAEDGETFHDNALIKAQAALEETGMNFAIADDSGLCVDELRGAPGVYSARWAGVHGDDEANNAKLLRELDGVPDEHRHARFHSTVVMLYRKKHEEQPELIEGSGDCLGIIGHEPRGKRGFGYDPLFFPVKTPGKTMAELSLDEKNEISHRRRALDDLAVKIRKNGRLAEECFFEDADAEKDFRN